MSELPNPLYAEFLHFKPRKGDVRKAQIIEATIACIATLGIDRTTFESIGIRAKIKRAHVAYHFSNLEDLVEAAIRFSVATGQSYAVKFLKKARTPKEELLAFIEGLYTWALENPSQVRCLLLLYYFASIHNRYQKLHDEIRELGRKRIESILSNLNPKITAKERRDLAKIIQSVLTGSVIEALSTSQTSLTRMKKLTIRNVFKLSISQ